MKSAKQSKTIWFNVVLGMIDVFTLGAHEHLQYYLTPAQIGLLLFALSVIQTGGNIYLRFITSQPIGKTS